jgi:P protein
LIVISITVCLFFLEPWLHYEPAWVAVIAAIVLMLLADPDEVDDALEHVEWGTLLFFGALFVFMEVVAAMGLIEWIGHAASGFISQVEKKNQLTVAILVITWISALASGFIDNIPYTTMMVRKNICHYYYQNHNHSD